jgi:thioredoxin 1
VSPGPYPSTNERAPTIMIRVEESPELQKAIAGQKAVVLVHATWCPFCRSFRPVFEEAIRSSRLLAVEAVVDDEENPLWAEHRIDIVPTVLFFEGGKVVQRLDGRPGVGLTRADLTAALAQRGDK